MVTNDRDVGELRITFGNEFTFINLRIYIRLIANTPLSVRLWARFKNLEGTNAEISRL